MRFTSPTITTRPTRVEMTAVRNAIYIENKDRSGSSVLYVQFGNPTSSEDALTLHAGDWRIFDRTQIGAEYGGDLWLWTSNDSSATVGVE